MILEENQIKKIINLYRDKDFNEIKIIRKATYNKRFISKIKKYLSEVFFNNHLEYFINEEDYQCYEFEILMHDNQDILDDDVELMKKLNGKRKDLKIFISLLGNYYTLFYNFTFFNEMQNRWDFKIEKIITDDEKVELIHQKMRAYGFQFLGYPDLDIKFDEIEIECKDKGEVKLFHMLFTELEKY